MSAKFISVQVTYATPELQNIKRSFVWVDYVVFLTTTELEFLEYFWVIEFLLLRKEKSAELMVLDDLI